MMQQSCCCGGIVGGGVVGLPCSVPPPGAVGAGCVCVAAGRGLDFGGGLCGAGFGVAAAETGQEGWFGGAGLDHFWVVGAAEGHVCCCCEGVGE